MKKTIAFSMLFFLLGCSSPPPVQHKREAPSAFDVQYWQDVNFCYAHNWKSSNSFCEGMAAAMANEYIKEHPERLDEPT